MQTIEAYGVFNSQSKLAQRSYFIVDKQGVVRYKKVQERGEGLVPNAQLVEEIRKINQAN
jgi:alkyl hydroperoxide reductase subunit AhpC